MKRTWGIWGTISVMVIIGMLATSCGTAPTGTPTPDQAATSAAKLAAETQAAVDAQATDAAGTAQAEQATAAELEAIRATGTQKSYDYATQRAELTQEAHMTATSVAAPMKATIDALYAEGTISRTQGSFRVLPDFDQSWAQIDWYQWWPTGIRPRDFVLTADLAWQSASDKANWYNSGCGFVFRETDSDNHYLAYLALDGYVYLDRQVKGAYRSLGRSYYGVVDVPNGSAQIMLVADGSNLSFYVNGKRVHYRQDSALSSGNLAMTLISGTNKGFGTRCTMTNVEVWQLE